MSQQQPRIVVIGGGFGGLEVAKRLRKTAANVTLIDRNNFHLFQPLLYQVATGGLSPANIATPLRMILKRNRNCEIQMANVDFVDVQHRRVHFDCDAKPVDYDYLVVAAGSTHSYFGNDDWEPLAPGLKTIPEATEIRRRIYRAYETAEILEDSEHRRRLLNFVVIGGGPTGVELAGAIAEISRHTLKHDFDHIDPGEARIHLIEGGDKLLSGYPDKLCQRAADKIQQLGVTLHLNTQVIDIKPDHVVMENKSGDSTTIPTSTVLWAAGVRANPLGETIADAAGAETNRRGQVKVNSNCTVGDHHNLFVIGDLAYLEDDRGRPLPGVAPVALQQGKYVARLLDQCVAQPDRAQQLIEQAQPFRYRDLGSMATIGRAAAIAQIGRFRLHGFTAWLMWLFVHLMQIVRFQNRVLILTQWAWNYLTFNRSARIIVNPEPAILQRAVEEVHELVPGGDEEEIRLPSQG